VKKKSFFSLLDNGEALPWFGRLYVDGCVHSESSVPNRLPDSASQNIFVKKNTS
jgi:hypothetical protein